MSPLKVRTVHSSMQMLTVNVHLKKKTTKNKEFHVVLIYQNMDVYMYYDYVEHKYRS